MTLNNFKKLTEFVDSLPSLGFPGCDVSVANGHEVIYRHNAGFSDIDSKTNVSGNELYYMYSCSKVVTCLAALQLFERGKFVMWQPLSDFLPEFADVKVKSPSGTFAEPAKKPILMKHLFTMTAGMTYDLTSPYIQEVFKKTGGRCPTRETVAAMSCMPLEFEPGSHFKYSLCHDVIAAVVEVISGQRFGEYVKKNIFDPCGMNESWFRLCDIPTQAVERLASQYRYSNKAHRAENTPKTNMYILGSEYESGGAGMITTVSDYQKFAAALASGGATAIGKQILSGRTIDMMRQNCLHGDDLNEFRARWQGLTGHGYGFGVRTFIDPTAGSISPVGQFGWQGAAGSYVIIHPETRSSLFFAMHMLNNQEAYVFPRLCNAFFADLN